MPIIQKKFASEYQKKLLIVLFLNAGGDPSLNDVYNNMDPPMTKEQWHIHDPSKLVATDGILMIAVTGKAQEDGYK